MNRGGRPLVRTSRRIDSRFALVVPFRARVSRFSVCSGNTPVQQARFWGIIPYPGSLSTAWKLNLWGLKSILPFPRLTINLVYPRDLGLRTLSNKEDCKTFDKWHLKGQERLTGQFLKYTDWSRFSLRLGETAGRSKKQQKTPQYCFLPLVDTTDEKHTTRTLPTSGPTYYWILLRITCYFNDTNYPCLFLYCPGHWWSLSLMLY